MKLLELSMIRDGVTTAVVAAKNDKGKYVIVDGFHRTQVIKYFPPVHKSIHGYIPVVELNKDIGDRIAATVRHNLARGTHQTTLSAQLVPLLNRQNWPDEKIGKELGMEPDEVLRLKQLTGLTGICRPGILPGVGINPAWLAACVGKTVQGLYAAGGNAFQCGRYSHHLCAAVCP